MKIADIEVVDHFYMKENHIELYIVRYASGKTFKYWNESHLPKTVKTFLKSHYDEYSEREKSIRYRYKAINIIK